MSGSLPWPGQGAAWLPALSPVLLLVAVALLLGRCLRVAVGDVTLPDGATGGRRLWALAGPGDELVVDASAGMVSLFVLLVALDASGIGWSRGALICGVLALLLVLVWIGIRRSPSRRPDPIRAMPFGWGDALAVATLGALSFAVLSGWITIPDFVYHWGLKGRRYWLEVGIDFAYLADPLEIAHHPDYPNLLPSLYAATAELGGDFDPRSMVAWTVFFVAACIVAGRAALGIGRAGSFAAQAGVGILAMTATFFAIGHDLAGGADVLIALSLLLALPALLRRVEPANADADDLRVGLAAALAAASKIEGVPLAVFMVAIRLWGGGVVAPRRRFHAQLRRAPRLVLPALLVGLPWLASCIGLGLFSPRNTGAWEAGRIPIVVDAAREVMTSRSWHGLPWLLTLIPALLFLPRFRGAAALLHLQGILYLFVYLTAPVDTRFYVLSSFPRLLYHLMLSALILVVLAVATHGRAPAETSG
jgi:hypothetical protein